MKKWNYFIAGLLGVLGILILIFPAFWIKLIVILLGLGAVGYGIYNFSYIKKLSDDSSYRSVIMVRSLVSIIIGLLAVILPMTVAETMWTIMIYVLAVYFGAVGIKKFRHALPVGIIADLAGLVAALWLSNMLFY